MIIENALMIIFGQKNMIPDIPFCLNAEKQIIGWPLAEAEKGDIGYEIVRAEQKELLRIWIIRSQTHNVILHKKFTAIASTNSALPQITFYVRAVNGAVKIVASSSFLDNQLSLSEIAIDITPDDGWRKVVLYTNCSDAALAATGWTFTISCETDRSIIGLEIRELQMGSQNTLEDPLVETSSLAEVLPALHLPGPGTYTDTNLLGNLSPFLSIDNDLMAPAEGWSILKGRNGDLQLTIKKSAWTPEAPIATQPRQIARIEIKTNEYYFRFVRPLKLSVLSNIQHIANELLIGADLKQGIKSGLAIQTFLRLLTSEGKEIILKLITRRLVNEIEFIKIHSNWSKDDLELIASAKTIQYIIDITGSGTLLLGSCWLGKGEYPEAKMTLTDRTQDVALREWHYQRFIETTEYFCASESLSANLACIVIQKDTGVNATIKSDVAATVRSVIRQTKHLMICIQAPEDRQEAVRETVQNVLTLEVPEQRIKNVVIAIDAEEKDAAQRYKDFISLLPVDCFVITFRAGDLARGDLARGVQHGIQSVSAATFVIFDHDRLGLRRRRSQPSFKPGISRHLLLETDYIGRGIAIRSNALQSELEAGALSPVSPFGIRDVALRLMETSQLGAKVDMVLLHVNGPEKLFTIQDEQDFISSTISRIGQSAVVCRWGNELVVKYHAVGTPKVSIIILFRDKADYLERCISSIFKRTHYANYEIILVDNNSSDTETISYLESISNDPRIIIKKFNRRFNYSEANNFGSTFASGEYLIFLNNDTEVLTTDWVDALIGYASLPDSGFVGARLHFGNGRLQHAGIVVGLKGLAGHALAGEHDISMPHELTLHTREVSAVTGAAMCIKAERFRELGLWDTRFILTGNDVEFCLRAYRRGFKNIFMGSVQLFHYEKTSRSNISVYLRDIQLSLDTYEPELSHGDPFWNRCLSRLRTDFLPCSPMEPSVAVERGAAIDKRLREMRARDLGTDTDHISLYDVDQATITHNVAVNEAYMRDEIDVRTAAWFVPTIGHVYRGGLFTCFRFAAYLYRTRGVKPLVVICSDQTPDFHSLKKQFAEAFPEIPFELHHFKPRQHATNTIPKCDLAVATLWTTAYIVARYECRAKFYLVQDYEPLFEAGGAGYGLIETSYRFGFFPICNSPGVGEAIAPYGDWPKLVFKPAVDRTTFFPSSKTENQKRPLRIIFYGRPNNPRNLFGLGFHALLELKAMYREEIEIISAGAVFDPAKHGGEGKILNAGLLPSIESVAALYRSCDIGLVFMQSKHPSYQPLEYMASGCVTVTNINEANRWLLRDGENCLLSPVSLTSVVDTLVKAVEDGALRQRIRAGGLATVSHHHWGEIEEQVASFMLNPRSVRSHSDFQPAATVGIGV